MGIRHAPIAMMSGCVTTLVLVLVAGGAERTPALRALALARGYLDTWQHTLTSLVADEEYSQEVRVYLRGPGSRASLPAPPTKRRLRSEVLLLRAPAENVWVSFRDVLEVDGKSVADRRKRFDALFSGPAALMYSTAERIAEESARFNLGRAARTLNTPTAALVFLHPAYEANTTWKLDSTDRVDRRPAWALRFDQRKPPFAITIQGGVPYASSGRFWIEPESGRILRTEVVVRGNTSLSRVVTSYGPARTVPEGWVPLRLEEEHDWPRVERINGEATYSNHRLFRTGGRIITPPPR